MINAQLQINAHKAQQMPRSELNVTHPHFLRKAVAMKQGVSNYSDYLSFDRSAFKNTYSNTRLEILGDTEAGLAEDNEVDLLRNRDLAKIHENMHYHSK